MRANGSSWRDAKGLQAVSINGTEAKSVRYFCWTKAHNQHWADKKPNRI